VTAFYAVEKLLFKWLRPKNT